MMPWRCIDDATVAAALPYRDLVAVIYRAFLDPVVVPQRLVAEVIEDGGHTRTLLTMVAVRPGGLAVTKLVTVLSGVGSDLQAHLVVHDTRGALIAVIAGHELTARRTAAVSVLAAREMGAGGAQTLAVLGAGRQARALMAAYVECLPISTVRIWARRVEAVQAMVELARQFSVDVVIAASPAEAAAGADIVSCATASREPLIGAADVAPGAHVDLVGGFRSNMREADDALIGRASVVADTAAALLEAGDLIQPIAAGALHAADVVLLAELLESPGSFERLHDFTLFKSVGHAAEDLIAVELLFERLGVSFDRT